MGFNPPHGVSTVGTAIALVTRGYRIVVSIRPTASAPWGLTGNETAADTWTFQSAPRRQHRGDPRREEQRKPQSCFNPPHGVSTVGTQDRKRLKGRREFQSAPCKGRLKSAAGGGRKVQHPLPV